MPTTIRVLGQEAPAAATETPLYTCAKTSAVISTLTVCNTSQNTPDTFSIRVNVNGAADTPKQIVFSYATVWPNTTVSITVGFTLATGDIINVTSTNGTCSFNLFGQEQD